MPTNDSKPIVQVENLHKWFDLLHVLRGVSFTVDPQEVLVLIGRSGSGKSTLLRCLNMLEEPSAGSITIGPVSVRVEPGKHVDRRQATAIRLQTGMVFQEFNLFPHMTALQNVIEGLVTVKKLPREEAAAIGEKYLDKVGLLPKRDVHPVRLSGGQKQRVAIARSLAMNPDLILYDEPTAELDPVASDELARVILGLKERIDLTTIIVSHDLNFALYLSDRVAMITPDGIVAIGTPAEIKGSQNPVVRSFIYTTTKGIKGEE